MYYKLVRISLILCVTFTLVLSLSGCSKYDSKDQTSLYNKNVVRGKSNMLKGLENRRTEQSTQPITSGIQPFSSTDDTPASTLHVNEYLDYWPDVSNSLDHLPGVAVAHVFVTNKNAYVALMYNDTDNVQTESKKGYQAFHRHDVAPRTLAAAPFDNYYTVNDNKTNEILHDIGRIVNNYAAPRQVFISDNHDFVHHLADFVKLDKRNLTLEPYLHDFNVLVQYYFAEGTTEPTPLITK